MSTRAARVLESQVICRQTGRYIGWPTIARAPWGELLVVFSGDRDAHVCPFGKTFLLRSLDSGQHWTGPELVNNTPLDDRDAGICACADGTLIVSWFTYYRESNAEHSPRWAARQAAIRPEDLQTWTRPGLIEPENGLRGHFIRRSTDRGHTWEDAVHVPPTAPHGPIELSDGRLLFVGNRSYLRADRSGSLIAAESQDKGRTWKTIASVPMFPRCTGGNADALCYLGEPHVAEDEPGRLVAMVRYEERPYVEGRTNCVLWQFDSEDGGHTWTDPRPTQILGKPPHVLRLKDGRLLVTYGYRHEPYGERACFSRDGGRTWDYDNEIVLRDDAPSGDLGYPASVECDDGTILTVYYQQERPGEMTRLMTTRWEPGD